MNNNRKRIISALLIAVVLFFTACDTNGVIPPIEEEPPPLASLEQYTPSQVEYDYSLLPNDEDVEDVEEPGEISLEEFVAYYIERYNRNISGFALTVFTKDDIIFELQYGYINPPDGPAVDSDTVFQWGSITKLLVYISVMQLYERGELDLHADILTYLPQGFLPNIPYPVTVHHLIHHTSGLMRRGHEAPLPYFMPFSETIPPLGADLRDVFTCEYLIQLAPPGQLVSYDDRNVTLASYVVERISGIPFYEYVHNNIFTPLNMNYTALLPDSSDNEWVYLQRDVAGVPRLQVRLYPSGAAAGTITDMVSLARALMPDENGDSILFENPETMLMINPSIEDVIDTPEDMFGRGFFNGFMVFLSDSESDRILGHTGGTSDFNSLLLVSIDSGVGIVFSENSTWVSGLAAIDGFFDGLVDIVFR
jgi:CubicO group peptidase (beta-lactamase class C family)